MTRRLLPTIAQWLLLLGLVGCSQADAQSLRFPTSRVAGVSATPTAAKYFRTALPVTVTTYATPAGGTVFAIPVWVPSDVTSVRVVAQNMAYNESAYADVAGVNVAIGTSNAATPGIDFSGPPTLYSSVTIGGVVPYVSPATAVTRGTDGKILVALGIPASTTVQAATGMNYTGRLTTGTTTVYPLTGSGASVSTVPFILQVQYATAAKRLVVVGDSISVGYNGYWDVPGLGTSPYYALGKDHGWATYVYGGNGSRLYNYFDDVQSEASPAFAQTQADLGSVVKGAIVDVEVGVNDLNYASVAGGVTAYTSYKVMVEKAVHWLRANGAKAIVFETLAVCSSYEAGHGAARVAYNNWISTLPFGIDAVIDRDATLSTATRTAGSTLKASFDSGDGCHPNASGAVALEAAAYAVLSAL